jgi:hypothetical protein
MAREKAEVVLVLSFTVLFDCRGLFRLADCGRTRQVRRLQSDGWLGPFFLSRLPGRRDLPVPQTYTYTCFTVPTSHSLTATLVTCVYHLGDDEGEGENPLPFD